MKQNLLFLELLKTVATIIVLTFLIKTFLIQTYIIDGQSMEPNFHNGEYLIIDKLSYRIGNPKRGDVVILIPTNEPKKNFIKRIIGLPGETVEIYHNTVSINGTALDEPYLKNGEQTYAGASTNTDYKITLKSDEYFVLGDNRTISMDSRSIGTVPRNHIIGKTKIVLFPFTNIHIVNRPTYISNVFPPLYSLNK